MTGGGGQATVPSSTSTPPWLPETSAVAQRTGDSARAEALYDEVVAIAHQTGDASLITYALLSAIPLLVDEGRIADARQRWQDAYRNAGGQGLAILSLALLGYAAAIAAAEGRPRRAVAALAYAASDED